MVGTEGEPVHSEQATAARPPKLLDPLRAALRARHDSRRTEETYVQWVRRYIFYHDVRHPAAMGEPEINAFLTHLAVKDKVSASTRNQALSALLFLYRQVLGRDLGDLGAVVRASKPRRLPVVLTADEIKAVLGTMSMRLCRNGRSVKPSSGRESSSGQGVTRSGTVSPLICWRPVMTFEPFRSCWGTRISVPP